MEHPRCPFLVLLVLLAGAASGQELASYAVQQVPAADPTAGGPTVAAAAAGPGAGPAGTALPELQPYLVITEVNAIDPSNPPEVPPEVTDAVQATAAAAAAGDTTAVAASSAAAATAAADPNLPQLPRRIRPHHPGGELSLLPADVSVTSPVVGATCKLDARGNVADVVLNRLDGTVLPGCTGGVTTAVLAGGRNVVLDFSDSWVVQVQQGKLSKAVNAPVAWLGFRTASGDLRPCGNVQPSSSKAVIIQFTASTTITASPPGTVLANATLTNATLSCATNVTLLNATQALQLAGFTNAAFLATLPVVQSLGYGLPPACTVAFTQPAPNVTAADNTNCKNYVTTATITQPATATCPTAAPPKQWGQSITTQQLPTSRPPNWPYRNLTTATNSVTTTYRRGFLGIGNATYITATVTHAVIPNVTSAMVSWWFNGNVEGDMLLNGVWYPRYLVWHPRDHVSQNTLIRGPNAGNATGAWWSLVEFVMAGSATGYNKSASSWANNYWVFATAQVGSLTQNSLELRQTVDGNYPFRLLHTWSDTTVSSRPALAMTSKMYLGLQPPYDNILFAGEMNPAAFKLFGGDCVKGAVDAWVKHNVEEMGNLQYFLPQLYSQVVG